MKKKLLDPNAEAQWAVDVLKSNGGEIFVNLYRVRSGKRIQYALAYAQRRGLVRPDRKTPPQSRRYSLTDTGRMPLAERLAHVDSWLRRNSHPIPEAPRA